MLCGFLGVCSLFRILPSKPPNFVPCFSKVWLHVTPGDGYLQFFSSGLLQQCFSLQSTHYFQFIHQLGPCSTTTYSCSGLCYYLRSFSNSFFCYLIICFPGPGSFNQVQCLKINMIIMFFMPCFEMQCLGFSPGLGFLFLLSFCWSLQELHITQSPDWLCGGQTLIVRHAPPLEAGLQHLWENLERHVSWSSQIFTSKAVKIISLLSAPRKLFSYLSLAFFNRSPQVWQSFSNIK